MSRERKPTFDLPGQGRLQVYLLGTVDFDAALALQRRLVYEIGEDRRQAALILCQHLPLITVGRQGSYRHILCGPDELRSHGLHVRWVNRGGGCLLHTPGQLAIYPILPLDRLGLRPQEYLHKLQEAVATLLGDFMVRAEPRPHQAGLWARGRLIACTGVAVRDWVTYYGAALNVNPALQPYRLVQCGNAGEAPMTSLERERRAPLSSALVRQRFVEHFATRFGFGQIILFTEHPALQRVGREWHGLDTNVLRPSSGAGHVAGL
jgi:lipoyl(octanoyl) transferase